MKDAIPLPLKLELLKIAGLQCLRAVGGELLAEWNSTNAKEFTLNPKDSSTGTSAA